MGRKNCWTNLGRGGMMMTGRGGIFGKDRVRIFAGVLSVVLLFLESNGIEGKATKKKLACWKVDDDVESKKAPWILWLPLLLLLALIPIVYVRMRRTEDELSDELEQQYGVNAGRQQQEDQNGTNESQPFPDSKNLEKTPSKPRCLKVINNDGAGVILRWEAPKADGGYPITHYRIIRKDLQKEPWELVDEVDADQELIVKDVGVKEGNQYLYRAQAVNCMGPGGFCNHRGPPVKVDSRTAVPMKPRELEVVRVDDSGLTLKWKPPESDHGSPVLKYVLLRKEAADKKWGIAKEILPNGAEDLLFYTDKGVEEGKEYEYRVIAVNKFGIGDFCQMAGPPVLIKSSPAGDNPGEQAGGPPTNNGTGPTAASKPTDVKIAHVDKTEGITLTWNKPESDGGAPILKYVVARKDGAGVKQIIGEVVEGRELMLTDQNLNENEEYTYRVLAVNRCGPGPFCDHLGAPVRFGSNPADGNPSEPLDQPTQTAPPPETPNDQMGGTDYSSNLKVSINDEGGVDLEWGSISNDQEGNPVLGYGIMRQNPDTETWEPIGKVKFEDLPKLTDNEVEPGKAYAYQVVPITSSGPCEPLCQTSEPTKPSEIPAVDHSATADNPSNLKVTVNGEGGVNLTWEPISNDQEGNPVIGYGILRQNPDTGSWEPIGKVKFENEPTFTDTAVEPDKAYAYQVVPITAVGTCEPLTQTTAPMKPSEMPTGNISAAKLSEKTTDSAAPDEATPNLKVTKTGDGGVKLKWESTDSADQGGNPIIGYGILRQNPDTSTYEPVGKVKVGEELKFIDSGVEPDKPYAYQVVPVTKNGPSEPLCQQGPPMFPPEMPTNSTLYVTKNVDGGVNLRWEPTATIGGVPIQTCQVMRKEPTDSSAAWTGVGIVVPSSQEPPAYTDTNVNPDKPYSYIVVPVTENGPGQSFDQRGPPTKPTEMPVDSAVSVQKNEGGGASVKWEPTETVGGVPVQNFLVLRKPLVYDKLYHPDDDEEWEPVADVPAGQEAQFVDTNVHPDQVYAYRVVPITENGPGLPLDEQGPASDATQMISSRTGNPPQQQSSAPESSDQQQGPPTNLTEAMSSGRSGYPYPSQRSGAPVPGMHSSAKQPVDSAGPEKDPDTAIEQIEPPIEPSNMKPTDSADRDSPQGVGVEMTQNEGGGVNLKWPADNETDERGVPIQKYQVLRKNPLPRACSLIIGEVPVGEEPRFTDNGVDMNKPYAYRVVPITENGPTEMIYESGPPKCPSALPKSDKCRPGKPVNLRVVKNDERGITLKWEPARFNGGTPITKYVIGRKESDGRKTIVGEVAASQEMRILDKQVTPKQTYVYRVLAVSKVGPGQFCEISGDPVKWRSEGIPGRPGSLLVRRSNDGSEEAGVHVSWSSSKFDGGSPIQKYRVFRMDDSMNGWNLLGEVAAGENMKLVDQSVPDGDEFVYRVLAVNEIGPGHPSIGALTDSNGDGYQDNDSRPRGGGRHQYQQQHEDNQFRCRRQERSQDRYRHHHGSSIASIRAEDFVVDVDENGANIHHRRPPQGYGRAEDRGGPTERYQLLRKAVGEGSWSLVGEVEAGDELDFMDERMEYGREYMYRIRAINRFGPCEAVDLSGPPAILKRGRVPPAISQFSNVNVYAGEQIRLEIPFVGDEPIEASWYVSGRLIDVFGHRINVWTEEYKAVLTINDAEVEDSGIYTLKLRNKVGEVRGEGRVTVHEKKTFGRRNKTLDQTGGEPPLVFIQRLPHGGGGGTGPTKGGRNRSQRSGGGGQPSLRTAQPSHFGKMKKQSGGDKPVIEKLSFENRSFRRGDQIHFQVKVDCDPLARLLWLRNKRHLRNSDHVQMDAKTILENGQRYRIASLDIKSANRSDHGNYTIRVEEGSGAVEESVRMKLIAEPPSAPKGPLVPSNVSETGCDLAWRMPDDDGGSPLICYQVQKMKEGSGFWLPVGNTSDTQIRVEELEPGQKYYFNVKAVNAEGQSKALQTQSPYFTSKPSNGFPPKPSPPMITDYNENQISLQWEPIPLALDQGDPIEKYIIEQFDNPTKTWKPCAESLGSESECTVSGLQEGELYKFRVRAVNSVGPGPPSDPSANQITKSKDNPPFIDKKSIGHMSVRVGDKVQFEVKVGGNPQPEVVWIKDGGQKIENSSNIFMEMKEDNASGALNCFISTLTIMAAQKSDIGSYTIKVENKCGSDEAAGKLNVVSVPSLPKGSLVASNVTSNDCDLAWKPLKDAGDCTVLCYHVQKMKEGSGGDWVPVGETRESVMHVPDLDTGSQYQFRVKAVSNEGESEPVETTKPVCTTANPVCTTANPDQVPPKPRQCPMVTNYGPEHIDIKWERVKVEGGAPVAKYMIEKLDKATNEWSRCAESLGPRCTVTGLKEGEECQFRVIAVNAIGPGPPSDPSASQITRQKDTPPAIVKKSSLRDQAVRIGDKVQFEVKVRGQPLPTVSWMKGTDVIQPSSNLTIDLKEDAECYAKRVIATLTITAAERSDTGDYTIKAENICGALAAAAHLDVVSKPTLSKGSLTASNVAGQECDLTWALEDTGGAPLISYQVQRMKESSGEWISIGNAAEPFIHVSELEPGNRYHFRVSAVNKEGPSEPIETQTSISIEPQQLDGLLEKPNKVEIPDVDEKSVTITWNPPFQSGGAPPIKYQIYRKESTAGEGEDAWTLVNEVADGSELKLVDYGLEEGKEYVYRVHAVNHVGPGPPREYDGPPVSIKPKQQTKNSADAKTTDDNKPPMVMPTTNQQEAPTKPPSRPIVTDFGPNHIQIKWEPAEEEKAQAAPETYFIEKWDKDANDYTVAGETPTTEYRIPDLVEGQEYQFRVRPVNAAGSGPPSETSVKQITAEPSGTADTKTDNTQQNQPESQPPSIDKSAVPDVITVSAGEAVRIDAKIEGDPFPDVSWMIGGDMNRPVENSDNVRMEIRKEEENGVQVNIASLEVKNAQRADIGDYKLKVENCHGAADTVIKLVVLTRPSVPTGPLVVSNVTGNGCDLCWKQPEESGDSVVRYEVEKKEEGGDDKWVPVDVSDNETATSRSVNDLESGKSYKFRVRAVNDQGPSDYLETTDPVTTQQPLPGPANPTSCPVVTDFGPTHIALKWDPPEESAGAPVEKYLVEKLDKGAKDYTPFGEISIPEFRVSGLIEGQEYQFRVRPVNAVGSGPPSEPSAKQKTMLKEPRYPYIDKKTVQDRTVNAGEPVRFDVRVGGNPVPEVTWMERIRGVSMIPVESSDIVHIEMTRKEEENGIPVNIASLEIKNAQRADIGEYTIKVENCNGKVEASMKLDVLSVASPPSAPSGPLVVSNITGNGCDLNWIPPPEAVQSRRSSGVESSTEPETAVSYEVEKKEGGGDDNKWVPVGVSTDRVTTFMTVGDLEPEKLYHFRVRAVNDQGPSDYLQTTDPILVKKTSPGSDQKDNKKPKKTGRKGRRGRDGKRKKKQNKEEQSQNSELEDPNDGNVKDNANGKGAESEKPEKGAKLKVKAPRTEAVKHNFALTNRSSTQRMAWTVRTNVPDRLKIDPHYGILNPAERTTLSVIVQPFDTKTEGPLPVKDRFTIIWLRTPKGATEFNPDWLTDDSMISKRKNVFIHYNHSES